MSEQDTFAGVHEVPLDLPDCTGDAGVVLKWRRRGDVWEGLVSREVEGRIFIGWLPALVFHPQTAP